MNMVIGRSWFGDVTNQTKNYDSLDVTSSHCIRAAWGLGGRAGWLVTGRLLVRWVSRCPWTRNLTLTSWLSPCMVDSAVGVWMCAWMLDNIVKSFEWSLVRKTWYKCGPFNIYHLPCWIGHWSLPSFMASLRILSEKISNVKNNFPILRKSVQRARVCCECKQWR